MWILWIIIFVVVLAFVVTQLKVFPPPNANTLVRIRDGELQVERGNLKPHARESVSRILKESGVTRGYIAITAERRAVFSKQIPTRVHQRLRNVLLNQWS